MNNSAQAIKGFKTFLITLVISLLFFSGLYVFVNRSDNEDVKGASSQESVFGDLINKSAVEDGGLVLAASDIADTSPSGIIASDTGAASSTTPATTVVTTKGGVAESSVPATGFVGPTTGLFLAVAFLVPSLYFYITSRKAPLAAFEKDTLRRL